MEDILPKIKQEVFARRPVLREIAQSSSISLDGYIQKNWQLPNALPDKYFLSVLMDKAAGLYGALVAEQAVEQLKSRPLVSTIDHLGIWGHPIFVNADLIYSLHFQAQDYPIILATESVSLNNTSSWSGSVMVHEKNKVARYSFFPDKQKTLPVFSSPAISNSRTNLFNQKTKGSLGNFTDVLGLGNTLPAKNFSEQAATASFKLWQAVFPSAPRLLYLPLETVVLSYLFKTFEDHNNIFAKLILTSDGKALWKKYFAHEHTFMFWGIDKKGRRGILTGLPEENELLSLMQNRKIYPSGPLCFAVLLYAGLACAGGFNQTTWLTQTKEKLLLLLSEMGEGSEAKKITLVSTKNFAESSLAWLKVGSEYILPSALDLYLTGKDYYPAYKRLSQTLTLGQSLDLALPEIYSVVVPKSEQKLKLTELEQERQKLLKKHLTSIGSLL